ncbi:hypothetical protein D5F01_LYC16309 [Larimichthys crocea]|uniref:Uncharacterized protein n=1 Tax=Larimichthys crocea TaxID=215358 RepID=A0A6G0I0X2_LARCR|nr:hypothetical protein D5F01_LYC16309 [Larimichthys crocea]
MPFSHEPRQCRLLKSRFSRSYPPTLAATSIKQLQHRRAFTTKQLDGKIPSPGPEGRCRLQTPLSDPFKVHWTVASHIQSLAQQHIPFHRQQNRTFLLTDHQHNSYNNTTQILQPEDQPPPPALTKGQVVSNPTPAITASRFPQASLMAHASHHLSIHPLLAFLFSSSTATSAPRAIIQATAIFRTAPLTTTNSGTFSQVNPNP